MAILQDYYTGQGGQPLAPGASYTRTPMVGWQPVRPGSNLTYSPRAVQEGAQFAAQGWNYQPGIGYKPPGVMTPGQPGGGLIDTSMLGRQPWRGAQQMGQQPGMPPVQPGGQRQPVEPGQQTRHLGASGSGTTTATDSGRGYGNVYNRSTLDLYKNIANMSGADRYSYLTSMQQNLMERLQRYNTLQARGFGGEMDGTAKRDYEAISASLRDINRMISDPAFMVELQKLVGLTNPSQTSNVSLVDPNNPNGRISLSEYAGYHGVP